MRDGGIAEFLVFMIVFILEEAGCKLLLNL
jgi:hypothetical protein